MSPRRHNNKHMSDENKGKTRVIKADEDEATEPVEQPKEAVMKSNQSPATKSFSMEEAMAMAAVMAKEIAKELMPKVPSVTEAPPIKFRGLYSVKPENYLDPPKTYYSFMALNVLGPYRDKTGQVKMPPNGEVVVTFPFAYERLHAGQYVPVCERAVNDKLMCEWIDSHPAYGLTVHSATVNDSMLSEAAALQQFGSRYIELFAQMDQNEINQRAMRAGLPISKDPEITKRNLAAYEAMQAFEAQKARNLSAQIDSLKDVAMKTAG